MEQHKIIFNRFEDLCREKVWPDLLARLVIWVLIGCSALYLSSKLEQSSIKFLIKQMDGQLRLINIIGFCSIALCFVGIAFKDAQIINNSSYGQDSKRGKLGGVVRRLASDFTIWTAGAIIAISFSAGSLLLFLAKSKDDVLISFSLIGWLGFLAFVIMMLNYYLRVKKSLIECDEKHSNKVFFSYLIFTVIIFYLSLST